MEERKKVRLDLDVLRVDSFETTAAEAARGTVHGYLIYTQYCTYDPSVCSTSCPKTVPETACSTKCNEPVTDNPNESLDCNTNLCN